MSQHQAVLNQMPSWMMAKMKTTAEGDDKKDDGDDNEGDDDDEDDDNDDDVDLDDSYKNAEIQLNIQNPGRKKKEA